MSTKKTAKLINRAHRYAAWAYNAHTKALQAAGHRLGDASQHQAKSDKYWSAFETTLIELKTELGIAHNPDER
jgi:HPt (histidine-containing phosphotransfer) domain-containing protein